MEGWKKGAINELTVTTSEVRKSNTFILFWFWFCIVVHSDQLETIKIYNLYKSCVESLVNIDVSKLQEILNMKYEEYGENKHTSYFFVH